MKGCRLFYKSHLMMDDRKEMIMACCRPAKILLPKEGTDLAKWAVVACDQFTSEPEYWKEADELVGDAPSTLRITLPEVYLEEEGVEERVAKINETMASYLEDGVLEELPAGMMLIDRDTGGPCGRKGLVLAFDLEAYDYKAGSTSLIRPTEKTVVERIPPRLAVRRDALVELPHIMLLIDDPERTVIEPLYEKRDAFEKKYSVDLMMNGGHIDGWFIPEGEATDAVIGALDALNAPERFRERYGLTEDKPLLPFATGDGNHSMATAKAAWEEIKKDLTPEEQAVHPARYVLAELVNIHDESLEIEAIYRVLFGVDMADVCHAAKAFFEAHGATFEEVEGVTPADAAEGEQLFPWYAGEKSGMACVKNSPWALPVATLQAFLDDYLAAHPEAKIDYIHGVDVLKKLSEEPGNMGFWLEDPKKSDLFRGVIMDGVLPRKTFSMGEAREKRYYMEAKKIK